MVIAYNIATCMLTEDTLPFRGSSLRCVTTVIATDHQLRFYLTSFLVAKDSSDLSTLQKLGVNAVLNLSRSVPSLFQNHLQYLEIRVCDNHKADLLSRLDEA